MSNDAIKDAVRDQLNQTKQSDWADPQLLDEINNQYLKSLCLMGGEERLPGIPIVRIIWERVGPSLCNHRIVIALLGEGTGEFGAMVVEVAAALSHMYAIDLACPLAVYFCRKGLKNLCREGLK